MENLPTPSINLAKNRGDNLTDRIIAFALTTGRVLVILTETIALGAFLYRFGLDRQLVDLHDRITQETAIVNLLKKNEATYRNLQTRLSLEKTLMTNLSSSTTIYHDLQTMVPTDMSLANLSFTSKTVHYDGTIPSLVELSNFINRLKSYGAVDSVSLDNIQDKTSEGTLQVSITVNLKPNSLQPVPLP